MEGRGTRRACSRVAYELVAFCGILTTPAGALRAALMLLYPPEPPESPFARGSTIQGRFRTCLSQTGPKPTLNCWTPVFDPKIIILGPPPEPTLECMVSPRARWNIHSSLWCPPETKNRPTAGKILEETPRPRTGRTPRLLPPPFPPFNIIKRVLESIASPIFSQFLNT